MNLNEVQYNWENSELWGIGKPMTPYQKRKKLLECLIEDWDYEIHNEPLSYRDMFACYWWFSRKAERYGLVKFLKERGMYL